MNKRSTVAGIFGLALVFLLAAQGARAGTQTVEFPLTGDIQKVQFAFETFEPSPKGVLLLAGGAIPLPDALSEKTFVGPPAPTLENDLEWRKYAQANHLALCIVRLTASKAALAKEQGHVPVFPEPIPNAVALLSKALAQAHLSARPLFLFGFREGGDFVGSLVNSRTVRIAEWACQATTHTPPSARETPYGIVAASDLDGARYDGAKAYAEQLRKRGAAVTWISTPGKARRNLKLEAFVRDCFAMRLAPSSEKAIAVDNETKTEVAIPRDPEDAATTSILPSAALLPGWSALHQSNGVVTMTVATGVKEFPKIVIALRLPPKPENARILAYCYYFTSVGNVLQMARDDKFGWNQFATKRGMAIVTWNVETLWKNMKSFDQIEDWDAVKEGRTFDTVASALEAGIVKLANKYRLRNSGILIYGCSRGASFALRLVMREPQRFSGVVAHLANSFERPVPAAGGVVWAITNGQLDAGAKNARRYYDQCRALGFPFFLRFFPGVAHRENKESLDFARAFFDYILSQDGKGGNFAQRLAVQLERPEYVADLPNCLVLPVSKKDEVPPGQRVDIPNKEMAKLWGRLIQ